VGAYHTCARTSDGTARCWGNNASGQLGDGTTAAPTAAARVAGLTGALQLAAGDEHTCALFAGGVARCWGRASEGALGDGTAAPSLSSIPVTVRFEDDAVRCDAAPGRPAREVCGDGADNDCDGAIDNGC
jgi:alpha-tubulin suppressor-like RCC1 family protein